ncbi:MAG TPA: hypothetical protein VFZ40_15595 [Pyrinomonadaceae bacterium]
MKESGSLFLQHLKNEATILIDSDGMLRSFLNSCELISPMESEIAKCEATLRFVLSCPQSPDLTAWKADFLFCVSRDYLIKRIARTGRGIFELEMIGRACQELFDLRPEEFNPLRELRKAKSDYRSEKSPNSRIRFEIDAWFSVLMRRFAVDFNGVSEFCFVRDAKSFSSYRFNSHYERLRFLEGLYLVACAKGLIHPNHELLMKHIRQPNLYGSSRQFKETRIQKYITDVVDRLSGSSVRPGISLPRRGVFIANVG